MTTPNETAQRILDRITALGQSDPVRPRLSLDVQRLAVAVREELNRLREEMEQGAVKRGRRHK